MFLSIYLKGMKFQIRHHFDDDDSGNNGYFLNCFPVTVIKHRPRGLGVWSQRGKVHNGGVEAAAVVVATS